MNDVNDMETTVTDPRVAGHDARDPRVAMSQAGDGGRGRHRGPVAVQDDEAAPRGRHRKPAEPERSAGVEV
ncbi:hypothetical protein G5C60_27435 [Streptomyces sp. HC44]|uniref:Uncharacterized protein n=1 Tax=Streptomyces scabichelini TaxID=2711217 RepID=A0A6G4VBF8_9ACTN|nr:hypothetical protein [Streptomyces scabichelini]NGO11235.1 hypothetical protein [Streptomyces scabichelini]